MPALADQAPISADEIEFFDNYRPSLEDGVYTIRVTSAIDGLDAGDYFDTPISQDFYVSGPQFSMPPAEVHSCYPPNNSNSIYDQHLPNIVLNKRALPWERYFDKKDGDIPWLCLMVFKEQEITVNPQTHSTVQSASAAEFLAADGDVLKPAIPTDAVTPQTLRAPCSFITISAEVFRAVAPKAAELKYLAHVRQVNAADQAIDYADESDWFSVISGNRLLKTSGAAGQRFYVHLVSLEGHAAAMRDSASAWGRKKSDPTAYQDIALASLYNWTFLSQPEQLNFRQLVENIAAPSLADPDQLLLRRTVEAGSGAAMDAAAARFAEGYVPLNYQAPSGENTFAWYRSPLTPRIAQPLPPPADGERRRSAAAAMIFDASSGLFDQTYAAAWSLGRATALADGSFSQALRGFRRHCYQLIGKLMDAAASEAATQAELSALLRNGAVRDSFKALLTSEMGAAVGAALKAPNHPQIAAAANTAPAAANQPPPSEAARRLLSAPAVQALLKDELDDELRPVAQWLARARALYGVPFNHLVPDSAMLPVESLRFFHIDQNWLDAFADGALSAGVQSSKDTLHARAMRGVIDDAAALELKALRARLLGTAAGDREADSSRETMCGILMRSAIVSGWPGLTVQALKNSAPLKTLRLERLSANVLLCIFLDIPDAIVFAEPKQGLCFGVEDGDIIQLRQLTAPVGRPAGQEFPAAGSFEDFFRQPDDAPGGGVLNINDGKNSIIQTLAQPQYLGKNISPAEFAIQMVKAAEEIFFQPHAAEPPRRRHQPRKRAPQP